MSEPDPDTWTDDITGRERVRMVVEVLDEPATVTDIAEEADVAWDTADSELDRMLAANRLTERTDDGRTTYGPDPVRQFFDQLLDLITENDRDELETRLVEYQQRRESLQAEHDAERVGEFRDRLTDEDRTAEEMRDIRNIASTWEALETEIRLTKDALYLYEHVSGLAGTAGEGGATTA